jgi:hypothetical protein
MGRYRESFPRGVDRILGGLTIGTSVAEQFRSTDFPRRLSFQGNGHANPQSMRISASLAVSDARTPLSSL